MLVEVSMYFSEINSNKWSAMSRICNMTKWHQIQASQNRWSIHEIVKDVTVNLYWHTCFILCHYSHLSTKSHNSKLTASTIGTVSNQYTCTNHDHRPSWTRSLNQSCKKSIENLHMSVPLEQSINSRDTSVPTVFEIFKGEVLILSIHFFPLHQVLWPNMSWI